MAFQEERIARNPISVVSMMSNKLMPSMPIRYFAPMLGIQSARSTIWKPDAVLSNLVTSGRETRKPTNPTRFAQSLMRFFWEPGISSSTTKPASGANKTMLSKCWSIVLSRDVIPEERQSAHHDEQRVGLHPASLDDAHRIR